MPDANGEITYAEQCAEREGTPTVAITNFELARILAGNPMMCLTLDVAADLGEGVPATRARLVAAGVEIRKH